MDFKQRYNITINPVGLNPAQADRYTNKVAEHLTWIYRTESGRSLLAAIAFHKNAVEITPYTGGGCNASGGWQRAGGVTKGVLAYSPDTFSLHGACSPKTLANNRGMLWDEILFHELIHVFRGVSGKWNQTALFGRMSSYTDTEEFLAVMLTNIYISDRTNKIKTGLRADHKTFAPLAPDLGKPFGLFAAGVAVYGLVKRFVTDNRGLATRLANINSEFNPIADYYADAERCEKLSKGAKSGGVIGTLTDMMNVQGL